MFTPLCCAWCCLMTGGMKFGVHGAGYSSIHSPMFCPAWIVPPVQDEKEQPGLKCETRYTEITFRGQRVKVVYHVLVPNESGFCYIKIIDDKQYAVLKRGLLCFGSTYGVYSLLAVFGWFSLAVFDHMILWWLSSISPSYYMNNTLHPTLQSVESNVWYQWWCNRWSWCWCQLEFTRLTSWILRMCLCVCCVLWVCVYLCVCCVCDLSLNHWVQVHPWVVPNFPTNN